ncbi:Glutamine transport ATP-binding protein GlnQ (plasmid) [Variovorax sp. SRS16]|uniref:amino acid ABC transporter ATP-binding protein n=1 Tax=Variovorax sp. SRS16 TaxID=282217 RepID=UPI0013168930|nr:amino acid ABC transporter ATP-binding protein [Variovorax sp. SRS16]VTU46414.1 Glutamine transport ATP-binding protein GlnQ [Variovorax sp. SRS16]
MSIDLAMQPEDAVVTGKSASDAPVLTLTNINKTFPGRRTGLFGKAGKPHHVLRDINLSVDKGEVVVIIGPSGSGKSTLLRCINMLTVPETGTVEFGGQTITAGHRKGLRERLQFERELRQLRRRIGMVFQHFNLFPHKTALKNVMLAQIRVLGRSEGEARKIAQRELSRVGLGTKTDAYPAQLSGGQKQRVAIARSLAMNPEIMLFDEATSALDPEIIEEILIQMKALASEGMTMVIVTHEIAFAREVGDRIIFMDDGEIVEQGPAMQMVSAPRHPRTQEFLRSIL